jgi:phosphate transport system protein
MRYRFDEQLEQLNVELIKMGALCEDAISAAAKALLDGDLPLIESMVQLEDEINHKERHIQDMCMRLLLQQQPVAGDLRIISSALKMISDMERIGDQAYDISEIARVISGDSTKQRIHIKDMAEATIKMVTDSVDSFVKKDLELAQAVMHYDDVVDDLFDKVRDELILLISGGDCNAEFCVDLLMVAKYFERIGDHAENIAEWVEYSLTGKHKKDKDKAL